MRRDWPGARRRRRHRAARAGGALGAAALALALVLCGLAYWRLSRGPVDLGAFTPVLLSLAGPAVPGGELDVGAVSLALGDPEAPGLALRLEDVSVTDASGRKVFAAPTAIVDLKPIPLLSGRFRPTELIFVGASATVSLTPEGEMRLGLAAGGDAPGEGGGEGPPPQTADASAALSMLTGDAPPMVAALESLRLRRLDLRVVDSATGTVIDAERADVVVRRRGDTVEAIVSAVLPEGRYGPVVVRAEGEIAADGATTARATFTGLAPEDVAERAPALAGLAALRAPVQGRVEIAVDASGELSRVAGELRLAKGELDWDGERVEIAGGRIEARYAPESGLLKIDRLAIEGGPGRVEARGLARIEDASGGRRLTAEVEILSARVASSAVFRSPQSFDGGAATLAARLDGAGVEIAAARLSQGDVLLSGSGAAWRGPEGEWSGDGRATLRDADAAALKRLWPVGVGAGAIAWIDENLEAGRIDRAEARLRADGGEIEATVAFSIADARARIVGDLPAIEAARGWGELTETRFALALSEGVVETPQGGTVSLGGSVFTIPDLNAEETMAEIVLTGEGPIDGILATLDLQPLGLPSRIGLSPGAVTGMADATARLSLPLLLDLPMERIAIDVRAELTDVTARPPGLDLAVTAERLSLAADGDGLSIEGDVRAAGASAGLVWVERFAPAVGEPATTLDVAARVGPAALSALGPEVGGFMDGAADVEGAVRRYAGGVTEFSMDVDLAPAALSGGPLAWSKPEGAPASGAVSGRVLADGTFELEQVSFRGSGLEAEGGARLGPDGTLRRLDLGRLVLDDRIDAGGTLTADGAGLDVSLAGALFDTRALTSGGGEPPPRQGPPVMLDLSLDTLRLDGVVALDAANGSATRSNGEIVATLRGGAGAADVTLDYRFDDGGERVTLTADDAGALLRRANVFDDGVGGALTVDATVTRDGGLGLRGEARMSDFAVSDDPALSTLLSRAEIERAQRGGWRFDTVRAPFTLSSGQLRLGEVVAYGPQIGVTVRGTYDMASNVLDLTGVFSPAFVINGILANVPIVGDLLTGGEGRGLVAFDFSMTGSAADPQVRVNPLSVLTPGVIRRIFSGGGEPPRDGSTIRERVQPQFAGD